MNKKKNQQGNKHIQNKHKNQAFIIIACVLIAGTIIICFL
jgi:hypothetical protein